MAAAEPSPMVHGGSGIMLPMLQKVGVDAWLRAHGKTVRPELTKKQKQELKECFDLIDADGSGAIDAEELVTAFNVLGMRVKKSEVEKMLAEVDADGSGELMEAVMGGDKAAQERLKAKAEEAEAERQAVLAAMEAEKQNPALQYDDKKMRTISDVKYSKMKKAEARRELGKDDLLPDYVVESLDDELKHILLESCEVQKGVHEKAEANPELETSPIDKSGSRVKKGAFAMNFHKQELLELGLHQTRVRHKPVLERQLLHLRAIKSIQEYVHNPINYE
ncbi:hypothetical protein GOP47_0000685 [Adiantum capillus-veneris]|uniref:EF-hand domain-containing protein n=1 Tax=Adiantum capillus-veneris TaxID=13818 RepID=A0A9D4VF73_ADICA|nr:hypothetical protein GOP47_0000685 [Adiantum capillus-veneris]